jgi:hypothetical protein
MTNPGLHRGGPGIDRAPKRANMEITTRISGPLHQDWRSRLASRAISARSQGVDPGGLVVLPFELPHCLSASPPNRACPPVNRIGDLGYCCSPSFSQAAEPSALLAMHAYYCPAELTRQTVFPTSLAISSAPVLSMANPTGRPLAFPSAFRKSVTTSSALPLGRRPLKGTKTTL